MAFAATRSGIGGLACLALLSSCGSASGSSGNAPGDSTLDARESGSAEVDPTNDGAADASHDALLDGQVGSEGSIDGSTVETAASEAEAAGGCTYVDVNDVVVKCGSIYRRLGHYVSSPSSALCAAYWAFGGSSKHPSREEAIAAEGCSSDCIWLYAESATRLYCGKKSGIDVVKASKDGCPDVYRFADGDYLSVEAHDAAHPCP